VPNAGPIPAGRYYIIKREAGGRLVRLRDFGLDMWSNSDRTTWFTLYSADGTIDDWTFVNGIRRGDFRLHPNELPRFSGNCVERWLFAGANAYAPCGSALITAIARSIVERSAEKDRRKTFGASSAFPPTDLGKQKADDARDEARRLHRLIEAGKDPRAEAEELSDLNADRVGEWLADEAAQRPARVGLAFDLLRIFATRCESRSE
jgi:hypothetical protein